MPKTKQAASTDLVLTIETNTELAASAVSTDDYAGDIFTAGAINIGASVTGNIELSGDTDWFRVNLTVGHRYRFDLQGVDSA
ncbi:MAG: hypothetical protein AB7W06_21870 [Alphaproteobacteria bacterium]